MAKQKAKRRSGSGGSSGSGSNGSQSRRRAPRKSGQDSKSKKDSASSPWKDQGDQGSDKNRNQTQDATVPEREYQDYTLLHPGSISDTDEPDLWRKDLTGSIELWIEVGQPDERRLLRAAGRADRVSVFAYGTSVPIWWQGLASRVARAANLAVWQIPAAESRALASLAARSMQLQFTVQDGQVWVGGRDESVEVALVALKAPSGR